MTNKLNAEVKWLDTKGLVKLHAVFKMYEEYKEVDGEHENYNIKDFSLFESAINTPLTTMFGEDLYPTIFDKVACTFRSLVCNHSLHNGNKRFGTMILFRLLELNNIILKLDDKKAMILAIKVAENKISLEEISKIIEHFSYMKL